MDIIRRASELRSRNLREGDMVMFDLPHKTMTYRVHSRFLDNETGHNAEIFAQLAIPSPHGFCSRIYGYKTMSGDFPYSEARDFSGLTRVVYELLLLCESRFGSSVGVDIGTASFSQMSVYQGEVKFSKPKSLMSNVIEFFKNITLSPDDKLLKEYGLEDPTGTPTTKGWDLSHMISYQANRAAIIEVAQKMKAEDDAKK